MALLTMVEGTPNRPQQILVIIQAHLAGFWLWFLLSAEGGSVNLGGALVWLRCVQFKVPGKDWRS